MAMPAKRGIKRTITLPNGTEKTVTLVGDEHLHYFVDADGNAYTNTGGRYVKADINQLKKRGLERRKAAQRHRIARMSRLQKKASARRLARKASNYTGKKKGLIILVEFSDKSFMETNNKALYNRIANEKNFKHGDFIGSVSDYFYAQSYGTFELSFDIAGPVKLSKKQSYYGQNDSDGNDMHPGEMVIEALNAIKDTTDFAKYDWDGDKEVDQVYILYAGRGEADGGPGNVIWPHEYTLTEEGMSEAGIKPQTFNGITIDTYACSNEIDENSQTAGIGNICHEFSHCLGYPDMYDTEYQNSGMGYWDLMDAGAYNGNGFCPPEYTSYERWVAGWKEPIELKNDTVITNMKAISENGDCFIMRNDNCDTEYYLLENRQFTGWDKELPGSGLLILHVDYYEDVWNDNSVNTTSGIYDNGKGHECMTWVAADNNKKYVTYDGANYYDFDDMTTDTYPYEKLDSFSNRSKPAATVYHKNTDGSKYLNKKVTGIKQNADGSISFNFALDSGSGSNPADGTIFFQETFNETTGTGGNDGKWSKTIASATLEYDNEGWTASWGGGGDQCARFGTTSVVGTATTPSFGIEGEVTLTFKAAAWGSEKTKLTVRAEGATITGDSSFSLENEAWGNYTTTLSGDGEVQITFTTVGSNKRFFLDEVMVFVPETTGISELNTVRKESPRGIYTLDGRRVSNNGTLPHGIYIVDGKKVVR
jgi:M6 family metalloprotease-like protein